MNLENFPTSSAAKRMLKTVSPIYDKSYVAKWIFQVMGLEIDEAWKFIEELRLQAFPETATWGILYWEQRYNIPPDDSLSIEERRQRVIIKRGKRSPMNPARIEQFTRDVTGRQTIVTEPDGSYVFSIAILPGEATVDYQALIDTIKSVKPSHLSFNVLFQTDVTLTIQAYSQEKYSFGYPLTGTVPDTNIVGVLQQSTLLLDANMEGNRFDYQLSGTGETGEYPETNMVGDIEQGSILPSITATGSVFDYQLCGESDPDL
jgi:hypothetical protein